MKLSAEKKFGWIHVHGKRVVRVTKTHMVPTHTWSEYALSYESDLKGRPKPDGPAFGTLSQVMAAPGDLAIEMVTVKKGKPVGFTYLSGAAIQLNRYDKLDTACVETATSNWINIPEPPPLSVGEGEAAIFQKNLIDRLLAIKYGTVDLVAFHYKALDEEEAKGFCDFLYRAWGLAPKDIPEEEDRKVTAHFIGRVDYTVPNQRNAGTIGVHFQPPMDSANHAATSFQNELAIELARRKAQKLEPKKPTKRRRKKR